MPDHALTYPHTDRDDTSDVLHGITVADPYRYLEDPDAPRTVAFVDAQNALSRPYLATLPAQAAFASHMTNLLTAPRFGVPWRRGDHYFMIANPGHLDQDQVFASTSLDELSVGNGHLLIDPNTWSADGTAALTGLQVSDDGTLAGYTRSDAGSDWKTIALVDVISGTERPDRLDGAKWLDPIWMPDGASFLYWHYPEVSVPSDDATDSGAYTDETGVGQLALHRLGQPQADDEVIWSRPEAKEWMVGPWVSDDGRWLVLTASPGTDSRTTITVRRIETDADGRSRVRPDETPVVAELADAHSVVGADGDVLYLRTERHAPAGRLVAVDLEHPDAPWRTILSGTPDRILSDVAMARDTFVTVWSVDTASRLEITDRRGVVVAAPELGDLVSFTALRSRASDTEIFVGTTGFDHRARNYRITTDGVVTELPRPAGAVVLPEVTAERRTAPSSDGTPVPMSVVRRADLPPGPHPTLLYGYGGFDIAVPPSFSALFAGWIAAGGVLVVANLRGGGEFGTAWHEAGMRQHKQRVFDDLYGCAEALIADGTTSAAQLAVHGRSNGGLLVGAAITQRPELFAAALPTVGVMDMLRFHRFTIGWAWTSEYGSPDRAEDFPVLHAYSPLHALREGVRYPPTLISTGDHDDRVVPAHSLKFGAQMQFCQAGPGPVLMRIDTRAGHGVGKPARALAQEYADQLAFAARWTGLRSD
ncbi:prolyl oligopeptidase Serine peptidase. MEROPS family S09A [Nakamurella panacisegetis]|uniref:prolyl oligopeptidase n=1 Tax=Nakamurella panacisegetis TaxID=1090615 RepID=A0A1H0RTG5_9ACTN|nr:prolyl oligopeptidase family serine peptidase [Nakamurella panacisegetis]SDP32685.1 prolyl oligopeptidase Serine peptidase. MEROPS family S09A [Nakamurella panacisegetis]